MIAMSVSVCDMSQTPRRRLEPNSASLPFLVAPSSRYSAGLALCQSRRSVPLS